jgi:putative MATE family efflux protein
LSFLLRIVLVLNVLFSAAAIAVPELLLGIITTDAEVMAEGALYLRIMGIGFLVWGFTTAATILLRSVGILKISVYVFTVSLAVSAGLNWLLIFGNLGFPRMGIAGAATATVIARFVEIAILSVYILKYDKVLCYRLRDIIRRGRGVAGLFMKHSLAVVLNEMFWAAGFFTLGVIVGRMGREFMAANAISGLLMQFSGILVFSFANATAVVVGNIIGEGRYQAAHKVANEMLVISLIIGVACAAIIQLIRVPFVNFYELSDLSRAYSLQLTHIMSVNVIFSSVALITMMGTLRGGGDTRFVMVTDVVFMWLIAIPLGAFTGLYLGWPAWIVFVILRSEDYFKTIICFWRVPKGKWLNDVTKGQNKEYKR